MMMDRVAGMISAPPTPMTARVAMSWSALLASDDAIEATPMMARPIASAPRRPNLSPSAPMASSSPANTRM
jgi:hypothetical protein